MIKGYLSLDNRTKKYLFEALDKSKKKLLSCGTKIKVNDSWGRVEHKTNIGYYFLTVQGEKIPLSEIDFIEIENEI